MTLAGASTTSWSPPGLPSDSPVVRSIASHVFPIMPPTWWITPNEPGQRCEILHLEVLHPACGVDDVLLRLRLGHAVPAGRRHAGVLADRERAGAEEHHPDRQRRTGLHPEIPVGAAGRPLAAAAVGQARPASRLAAAGAGHRDRGAAADGAAHAGSVG